MNEEQEEDDVNILTAHGVVKNFFFGSNFCLFLGVVDVGSGLIVRF